MRCLTARLYHDAGPGGAARFLCVCVCSRDAKVLWQILLVRKEKESKKLLRIVASGL